MVAQYNDGNDLSFLRDWAEKISVRLAELRELTEAKGLKTYFSIGSTTDLNDSLPYLTPIRFLENGAIFGVIVFSQTQALIAANLASSYVDSLLVDTEKKIGITVGVDNCVLSEFGISTPSKQKTTRSTIEFGNIAAAVRSIVSSEKIIEYKPNDITVEAAWSFLSQRFGALSGKKIGIIGCGNIGFKLALKLVESGVNVSIYRRDSNKGAAMANAINLVKPSTTLASASYAPHPLQAAAMSDAIVTVASAGSTVVDWPMLQSMTEDGFVLDVGKGNLSEDAIENALLNGVEVVRGDVSAALYGFISTAEQQAKVLREKLGRRTLSEGVVLVSGGLFGAEGEIVVDNYKNPEIIYGVSDGKGNIKIELSAQDKYALSSVQAILG